MRISIFLYSQQPIRKTRDYSFIYINKYRKGCLRDHPILWPYRKGTPRSAFMHKSTLHGLYLVWNPTAFCAHQSTLFWRSVSTMALHILHSTQTVYNYESIYVLIVVTTQHRITFHTFVAEEPRVVHLTHAGYTRSFLGEISRSSMITDGAVGVEEKQVRIYSLLGQIKLPSERHF